MAVTAPRIAYPDWTEYRKKNGLDPLGMQNSSVGLYQTLLPGISNVTLRVRYFGFYVWLCREYARHIASTDPRSWQRVVRRAEALYALVAQRRGGESGIAGIQWASRTLSAADSSTIDFAADAEPGSSTHYLKQAWGAYGAAYASQLYELGIFGAVEAHALPVPGPEIGDPLADAFESAIGSSAKQFFGIVQRGWVSPVELDALSAITPSGIGAHSDERESYEKILFGRNGLDHANDRERRRTLLLVLSLAARLGRIPDVSTVRWALYTARDPAGNPISLKSGELADHRDRWWVYQANDLTHICYEALLKFSLDLLEPHPGGIPLERLIGRAVIELKSVAGKWPESWADFLHQNLTDDPTIEPDLCSATMQGAQHDRLCTAEGAWAALRLLAVLHNRARASAQIVRSVLGFLDPSRFRSLLTELQFLDANADNEFAAVLHRLIEQRIIRRHLWIALRKLRYQGDYTFLIEADDGRVRLRAKDGPVFTNPRLGPAITFLRDIHLIDDEGLTEYGRNILDTA